jgi:type I restriction enzyme, S subunit
MNKTNITYKKYPAYKNSEVEWLGEIPEHWSTLSNKFIFKLKKNPVGKKAGEYVLLSLTLNGIIKRDMINPQGKFPAEFDTYQEVKKGDFVFCLFDVEETPRAVGLSDFDGMITGAYTVMSPNDNFDKGFLYYFYLNLDTNKRLKPLYTGLRNIISKEKFFSYKTFVPPKLEQTTIATFLDTKTSKIDYAISNKQKLIQLLKERKQIMIQELVTGKKIYDANTKTWTKPTKTKNSGVEWIGEIPEEWEVKRLKYVAEINKNSLPENTIASFEFEYVDIGNVSFENGIEGIEKYSFKNSPSRARRIANKNDTIISTVRTYLKAIDYVSEDKSNFIYSTGFAILTPINIDSKFLYNFVKSDAFTEQVTIDSKGMSYPAINSTDLSKLVLVIPPAEEQLKIVLNIEAQTSQIDSAISLQEQQIEKLKEYKASLIDGVVRGKVCVIENCKNE